MNLGRALVLSGDIEGGLKSNRMGLAIRAELFAANASNADYRRLLAISYQNDGDYRSFLDDTAGALDSFRKKLALDEQSLADDPVNLQARADLAYTCERLGALLGTRGVRPGAPVLPPGGGVDRGGVGTFSAASVVRYSAILTRAGLAETQAKVGERSGALAECSRVIALLDETADDPTHSGHRNQRGRAYIHIARAYAALAASGNAAPAEQREHWHAARAMYVRSQKIWLDMQRRGILTGEDAAKPEEVAREIALCDASLQRLA